MSLGDQAELAEQVGWMRFVRPKGGNGAVAAGYGVIAETVRILVLELGEVGGGLVGGDAEAPHEVFAVNGAVPVEAARSKGDALFHAPAEGGCGGGVQFDWFGHGGMGGMVLPVWPRIFCVCIETGWAYQRWNKNSRAGAHRTLICHFGSVAQRLVARLPKLAGRSGLYARR